MTARSALALAIILAGLPLTCAQAEPRKPTAQEVASIRNCATKYQDDLDAVERECLFKLVGDPCTNTPEGSSNVGTADCYRLETSIWDNLLNQNFKEGTMAIPMSAACNARETARRAVLLQFFSRL
jgi:hypothetical protein